MITSYQATVRSGPEQDAPISMMPSQPDEVSDALPYSDSSSQMALCKCATSQSPEDVLVTSSYILRIHAHQLQLSMVQDHEGSL